MLKFIKLLFSLAIGCTTMQISALTAIFTCKHRNQQFKAIKLVDIGAKTAIPDGYVIAVNLGT